jgi:hypothetical protein
MEEKNTNNQQKESQQVEEENINNQQEKAPQAEEGNKENQFTKTAGGEEKKEPSVILEVKGDFVLIDEMGKEIESDQAKFILDEEKISVASESGKATSLPLRDIGDFYVEDYKIHLLLPNGGKIIIAQLGYQYEDFVRMLTNLRHEIIQKELLFKEGVRRSGFEGEYDYQSEGKRHHGRTKVEICDTGLVLKPEQGDLIRIPFSEIREISEKDYKIFITAQATSLELSLFGEKFNSLSSELKQALAELSLRTQELLKEFLPELDPLTIKKAAELLKDGKAVNKIELDKISPKIWSELEKELGKIGILESYNYLKSLSKSGEIFVGIKRDLMGDLTGEYIWFLMPISSQKGGNFFVMEAGSTIESGGKATYLFKMPTQEDIESLAQKFNSCMLAINFRREPIYLKDEDLEKPDYSKYKIAISKIPELKLLRQLFAGRVIHTSPENWKENINKLINQ